MVRVWQSGPLLWGAVIWRYFSCIARINPSAIQKDSRSPLKTLKAGPQAR
jgi:hypothetical protein